jgi:hypothetical protein
MMNVTFTHPSSGKCFEADCHAARTGSLAIQGLIQTQFLSRPTDGDYDLVLARTQSPILLNETFGAAGVRPGDVVSVVSRGAGALANQ